jgi:hypothetical protein
MIKKLSKTVKCVKMVKCAKVAYAMPSLRAYSITRVRISTVDLLTLTSSDQLLLILNLYFYKAT